MLQLLNSPSAPECDASLPAVEVRVDAAGRIHLPEDVQRQLGIRPGDAVLIDVTDDGILLWTREMAARALVDLVSRSVPPATSLVAQLTHMCRAHATSVRVHAHATPVQSRHAGR